MPGLRSILLGLGALLIVAICWWGARRSRQAPGNPELRESRIRPPAPKARTVAEEEAAMPASSDWGVPPFEPLSIRTADFEAVEVMDGPMMAHTEPLDDATDLGGPVRATARTTLPAMPDVPTTPAKPAAGADTQRIVTLRVGAVGESRWAGSDVLAALENHGLKHGRYQVFHRLHSDGRSLFCAASLVEPGTFDIARMSLQEFRGLSLFAVLPGPAAPLQTLDALIETALELANALQGTVQDADGVALTAGRAEAMREDLAHFASSLT